MSRARSGDHDDGGVALTLDHPPFNYARCPVLGDPTRQMSCESTVAACKISGLSPTLTTMSSSHRRASGTRFSLPDDVSVATQKSSVIDDLAVEEPLEIRIGDGHRTLRSVVTMRTPGADLELAAGWLTGEGIIATADDLIAVRACTDASIPPEARGNVVTVDLRPSALPRLENLSRTTDISGACGVCGSESLTQVTSRPLPTLDPDQPQIDARTVIDLPDRLAAAQRVFARTGGLHGAAVSDSHGQLLAVREDIGRHNAVDKVLGWALMNGVRPEVLVVSSRASFEIVQKAAASGVAIVVTVSAASTLAVDLAQETGVTLIAFARSGRATVYAHPSRVN